MKQNRFIVLLLLVLLFSLTACTGEPNDTEGTSPPVTTVPTETTEPPQSTLVLIADGQTAYTIVRGENATQNEIDAAIAVRNAIGELTGVHPDLTTDWVRPGAEPDASTAEILIGNTVHPESDQAIANLRYGEYVITQIGQKLVIHAPSDQGLTAAAAAFSDAISVRFTENKLALDADLRIIGTAVPTANELPLYPGGELYTVYHAGDDNQLVIINQTDPDEYAAYCSLLETAGYSLYTKNDVTGNHFATYANDTHVITAGYYAYEEAARLIIEPRTYLPPLAEQNQYQKIMEPTVAMLGLEFGENLDDFQNGMAYVFQLADGSYIIIDGGFHRSRDADALYQYLYQNAPDPNNITIAAWIMTHAHKDHTGTFYSFSDTYADKVNVELIAANFASDETRVASGNEGAHGYLVKQYAAETYKTDLFKMHVGQKLYLRDAEVEFLFTLESFSPRPLTYFNTSSVVFTVNIAGQRFLFLADASSDSMNIVSDMYGDYLKSDFIQPAHHGYTTGTNGYTGVTRSYELATPSVILWPVGDQGYDTIQNRNYNVILRRLPSVKEIMIAGSRDIRLTLPYLPGTSGLETILK